MPLKWNKQLIRPSSIKAIRLLVSILTLSDTERLCVTFDTLNTAKIYRIWFPKPFVCTLYHFVYKSVKYGLTNRSVHYKMAYHKLNKHLFKKIMIDFSVNRKYLCLKVFVYCAVKAKCNRNRGKFSITWCHRSAGIVL